MSERLLFEKIRSNGRTKLGLLAASLALSGCAVSINSSENHDIEKCGEGYTTKENITDTAGVVGAFDTAVAEMDVRFSIASSNKSSAEYKTLLFIHDSIYRDVDSDGTLARVNTADSPDELMCTQRKNHLTALSPNAYVTIAALKTANIAVQYQKFTNK